MEKGFIGTIIGGITVVAVLYILLAHASNVQSIASHGTAAYANVAKSFQGTPGV